MHSESQRIVKDGALKFKICRTFEVRLISRILIELKTIKLTVAATGGIRVAKMRKRPTNEFDSAQTCCKRHCKLCGLFSEFSVCLTSTVYSLLLASHFKLKHVKKGRLASKKSTTSPCISTN